MGDIKVNEVKTDTIKNQAGTSAMTINSSGEVDMVRNNLGLFQVYLGANQNIASSSTDIVGLNTKVFDTDSYFNTSNYRYTPQVAGFYYIECKLSFRPKAADDNVNMNAYLYKNGSHSHSNGASPYLSANDTSRPIGQMCMKVGAGKEIEVQVNSLVYFNGSSDYVDLRGNMYNYTNSSATDNHVMGHSTQMMTYMLGYRVG